MKPTLAALAREGATSPSRTCTDAEAAGALGGRLAHGPPGRRRSGEHQRDSRHERHATT